MGTQDLNGDLGARVVVDSAALEWVGSPSDTVFRKRLHRVGPAESGQVTSVVRYAPSASFPEHGHPEGEEFLVLEGTFSDEHGDFPAGSYVLNPEGVRHAPFSREGCTIFVKLRQYAGLERPHVVLDTLAGAWVAGEGPGVERQTLFADPRFPDATQLERFAAGAQAGLQHRNGGAEILVLEGTLQDEHGSYAAGTWIRLPDGAQHSPRSESGCLLYVKTGGVAGLRAASP